MPSNLDDLCVLPHIGPEKQGILRENDYETYERIAQAKPRELYVNCSIGLSETSAVINAAIDEMACPCPKCGSNDINPMFGGFPDPISEEDKTASDLFCAECHWFGQFADIPEVTA